MAGFATFLAACGTPGTGGSGAPASAGRSAGGSERARAAVAPTLRFANWIGYIDTAEDGSYPTLLKFTAETGIEVNYLEDIDANEEFFAATSPGPLEPACRPTGTSSS